MMVCNPCVSANESGIDPAKYPHLEPYLKWLGLPFSLTDSRLIVWPQDSHSRVRSMTPQRADARPPRRRTAVAQKAAPVAAPAPVLSLPATRRFTVTFGRCDTGAFLPLGAIEFEAGDVALAQAKAMNLLRGYGTHIRATHLKLSRGGGELVWAFPLSEEGGGWTSLAANG